MLDLPYSLKTILHEMRGLFIPIWLCLAKIDEVEMFVKARNFLILGLDRIGRGESVMSYPKPLSEKSLERLYKESGLTKEARTFLHVFFAA